MQVYLRIGVEINIISQCQQVEKYVTTIWTHHLGQYGNVRARLNKIECTYTYSLPLNFHIFKLGNEENIFLNKSDYIIKIVGRVYSFVISVLHFFIYLKTIAALNSFFQVVYDLTVYISHKYFINTGDKIIISSYLFIEH